MHGLAVWDGAAASQLLGLTAPPAAEWCPKVCCAGRALMGLYTGFDAEAACVKLISSIGGLGWRNAEPSLSRGSRQRKSSLH